MGTDSLTVQILGPRLLPQRIGRSDVRAGGAKIRIFYKQISPTVTMMGAVKIGSDSISTSTVTGVSEDYFDMKGYTMAQGRESGLRGHDTAGRRSAWWANT